MRFIAFILLCSVFVSCQSLKNQSVVRLDYQEAENISVQNKKIDTWFSQHPSAECIPQWPDTLKDFEFEEVDDWLAPLDMNGNTYVWSFKPKGKEAFYYNLADSFYHMREYEKARTYYLKTLDVNPNNWFACLYLGDTFFIADEFDTAAYWFKKSISINSYNWKNWKYLADLYISIDEKDLAIDAAIRSILLNPYNFESWTAMAYLGRKYNFEIWNPQDSLFMRSFKQDSVFFVLYRQNEAEYKNELYRTSAQNLYVNLNNFQKTPDSLYSEFFNGHPVHHKMLVGYSFAYEVMVRNWETIKPKDNPDELYKTDHYSEYIEATYKMNKLPYHVFWTDILRMYPHAAMYLSQKEMDELVHFFWDNYILITF